MRRVLALVAALAVVAAPRVAEAKGKPGLYKFDPKGKVRAVRAIDVNGDGKRDVLAIVDVPREGQPARTEILVLTTPVKPNPTAYFGDADVKRIACDDADLVEAGAVAIGRFPRPDGQPPRVRMEFLAPHRTVARSFDGSNPLGNAAVTEPAVRPAVPVGRSAGAPLVFWDSVDDLDGDGTDEWWRPGADSPFPGLRSGASDEAQRSETSLFVRKTKVAHVKAADVDGDGKKELVGLDGTHLVAWKPDAKEPVFRVHLPFLVPDPARPPEEIRTPRLTVADADGDGKADLLVTLVAGRADKLGGLRTSLYHYAAPLVDPKTGNLVEPRSRIDTESVALHPRFVDVDGDGKLDYVADSIRGTMLDLIRRIMGADPTIFYSVYRFDPKRGTYEPSAWVDVEKPYSGAEARGNTFGRAGFLEGDFDGDGLNDLLDLGDLKSVSIWRGRRDDKAYREALLPAVGVPGGETLVADAIVSDLDGDKVSDAVLWTEKSLLLVVSGGVK